MTVFEKIKQMDIDEFAKWFDDNCAHDNDPAIIWWNEEYCSKCKPVIAYVDYLEREEECAWCEVNDCICKFFQDLPEAPRGEQMAKLWLNSEW